MKLSIPLDSILYQVKRVNIADTITPSFEFALSMIDPITLDAGITRYHVKVVRTRTLVTENPEDARAVLESARREFRRT